MIADFNCNGRLVRVLLLSYEVVNVDKQNKRAKSELFACFVFQLSLGFGLDFKFRLGLELGLGLGK